MRLGWEPKTSFEEGLDLTITNYRYLKDKNVERIEFSAFISNL